MPMTRGEKLEKVQRLLTAHRKTKEMVEREPVTWELHPGTDIARKWTVITAAYSGLEQTFKYLIAEEKACSIEELIEFAVPDNENANHRKRKKYPYRTHNLAWLFSQLRENTQDIVRDFFGRFQSLHSYITLEGLDQFLEEVSSPKGDGYERWRYTLIEEKQLPRNSPEALAAVWGVSVAIAEEGIRENQRVRMPDEELAWQLCQQLEVTVDRVSIDRQNAGGPFQNIEPEIRTWLRKSGHPLNAFAEVLWHFSRYGSHGVEYASDWLSDTVQRWVKDILESPAAPGPTSLRSFIHRAQGHTREGGSIRWNPNTKRFEAVPWSLDTRSQADLPLNATVVGDLTRQGTQLRMLWEAAKDSGYRVLENRSFAGSAEPHVWFRTLEVQAEDEGNVKPVLTMWQRRDDDDVLVYMVEECPRDAMSQRVRAWIDLALKIGEIRQGKTGGGAWG